MVLKIVHQLTLCNWKRWHKDRTIEALHFVQHKHFWSCQFFSTFTSLVEMLVLQQAVYLWYRTPSWTGMYTHTHTHTCPTLGCCMIVVLIFHAILDTTVLGFNKFSSFSASVLSWLMNWMPCFKAKRKLCCGIDPHFVWQQSRSEVFDLRDFLQSAHSKDPNLKVMLKKF